MRVHAITVNGLVRAEDLGFVLPHEHVYCDLRFYCTGGESSATPIEEIPNEELQAAPLDFLDNLDMRDEVGVRAEVDRFRQAGGATLVELSTRGLAPDHSVLQRISTATGVHVIAGTGYYVGATHPATLKLMNVDAIAEEMVREIRTGDEETGVRAGIIGEIGTSDPILEAELNVVRAAAKAQIETGCPINVHFSPGLREVFTVIDALGREGLTKLDRVVVSHADDILDLELHERIMGLGAIIEYDTFGNEEYPSPWGRPMPTDEQRVAAIATLIRAGWTDQLLVSQDVCMKSLWCRFGGRGYVNLLQRVPAMLAAAGVSDAERLRLSVTNSARLLAFVA